MSASKPKKHSGPVAVTTSGGTSPFVLGKFKPGKLSGRYSWLTALSCIVLVLVLAWLFGGGKDKHTTTKQNPELITTNQTLLPAQQAQVLRDKGDYSAAEQVWQKQLDQTQDTPGKLSIYYQMAQVALKFKRYDDATNYAAKAMLLDSKSYVPYAAYASIAEAKGDKASAKQYLEQAIAHIDPNLDGANLITRDYQAQLDSLK